MLLWWPCASFCRSRLPPRLSYPLPHFPLPVPHCAPLPTVAVVHPSLGYLFYPGSGVCSSAVLGRGHGCGAVARHCGVSFLQRHCEPQNLRICYGAIFPLIEPTVPKMLGMGKGSGGTNTNCSHRYDGKAVSKWEDWQKKLASAGRAGLCRR